MEGLTRVVEDVWNFWNFWDFLKSGTSLGIHWMLDHFGLLSRKGNDSEVKIIGKNKKEWKRMKIKGGSKVKAVKGHTVSQAKLTEQAVWKRGWVGNVLASGVCRYVGTSHSGERIVVCMSRNWGQIKQKIFYKALNFGKIYGFQKYSIDFI